MHKPQKHYKIVKETRHKRLFIRWSHLYDISKKGKSRETASRSAPARMGAGLEVRSKWAGGAFWGDRDVLKPSNGDGRTIC